jgi:ATP adenylyltransferase
VDILWSPWRYRYIAKSEPSPGCLFCTKASENRDAENYVLYRGDLNFVLLNLYPYTAGHLMIAPYEHVDSMANASPQVLEETMRLTRQAEVNLRSVYRPDGLNIGMNLGSSAGAGVAGHIHMHVVPRWVGDANFMSIVGETRVLPEELPITYEKLRKLSWMA